MNATFLLPFGDHVTCSREVGGREVAILAKS